MSPGSEAEIWRELGEDGCRELVAAFYRQVPGDDILGPMYRQALAAHGEEMREAETRLADFLAYRIGGIPVYIEQRGHPRLRARHMPFAIDARGADRWMSLMDRALDSLKHPLSVTARTELRGFFAQTARFMVNT